MENSIQIARIRMFSNFFSAHWECWDACGSQSGLLKRFLTNFLEQETVSQLVIDQCGKNEHGMEHLKDPIRGSILFVEEENNGKNI